MNLFSFFQKNVRILDIEGEQWTGFVKCYISAADSDDGLPRIAVDVQGKGLIEFQQSEIIAIQEVISD